MLALLCCCLLPIETKPLPDSWLGTWQGTLTIDNGGKPSEVPFKLVIKKLPDAARLSWHITYGEGEKASTRPYELVAIADKPGDFELDEKSGIRMRMKLLGNQLFCLFKVSQSLLHVKYALKGDVIHYEISSYQMKEALKTGFNKDASISVDSYQLLNVQSAELTRVK